jgi:hypothetical protein
VKGARGGRKYWEEAGKLKNGKERKENSTMEIEEQKI